MIKEEKVLLKRFLIWVVIIAIPLVLFVLLSCAPAYAQDHTAHSAHTGKETRDIKALPTLDLRDKLMPTTMQISRIEQIYAEMNAKAIALGRQIVLAERELDTVFAARAITLAQLNELTANIGKLHATLRSVHLGAHLTTTSVLTKEQIHQYDVERGYRKHHE